MQEAILGAQQTALAEKMARTKKTCVIEKYKSAGNQNAEEEGKCINPTEEIERGDSSKSSSTSQKQRAVILNDAQVQTDFQPTTQCQCKKSSLR